MGSHLKFNIWAKFYSCCCYLCATLYYWAAIYRETRVCNGFACERKALQSCFRISKYWPTATHHFLAITWIIQKTIKRLNCLSLFFVKFILFWHVLFAAGDIWICKPTGRNQGKGIYLVRDAEEIRKLTEVEEANRGRPCKPLNRIIQRSVWLVINTAILGS